MGVVVALRKPSEPFALHANVRRNRPYRIHKYQALVAGSRNESRWEDVQRTVKPDDVVIFFYDSQHYMLRIFHCSSATILPMWYADYLLFKDAPDVESVTLAQEQK